MKDIHVYKLNFPKRLVYSRSAYPWEHNDAIAIFTLPRFVRNLDIWKTVSTLKTRVFASLAFFHLPSLVVTVWDKIMVFFDIPVLFFFVGKS